MTTDITELAQNMSIERIKQIALGGTPTMGEKERLAITALYFSEQLKIATDAFQAAGLAQLAAEEALEKAQRANAAQDDHINQQQDRIDQLEKKNAELGKYAGSLEASHKKLREGMAAIYNAICADGASTSVSAILTFVKRAHAESAAAGIKWEAE